MPRSPKLASPTKTGSTSEDWTMNALLTSAKTLKYLFRFVNDTGRPQKTPVAHPSNDPSRQSRPFTLFRQRMRDDSFPPPMAALCGVRFVRSLRTDLAPTEGKGVI
ncbi:hypothetical protein BT96DRAFT_930574 [Gymnopus androsaceus JB14]|uniref:Uncharacterized protein n=1 Tax=Gymnopus androsaceus JB14 TaxID=1447944 RepID=A0A6A4IQH9_9AGAR|nr:hypothetical protein BT96DRAFT_930574 [Gymnopus androsaceus JB14]